MNLELARKTIAETFRQKFDDARFLYFIRNLVNHLDESDDRKKTWTKQIIKAAFQDYVNHYTRLGTYSDPDGEKVDVLVIYLRKDTTLSRGRVTLRNFVADYLATGHGQGKAAVMAAFVSPDEDDWRFSFVKLDFTFEKTELGFVSERVQLTPARRYSYLVGKNENCHTAQKQFLALLTAEEINPKIAQLEAAFSVEKVTKEFFDHYRELFEKTRDALTGVLDSTPGLKEHFDERGIACDDFAKKLLGQIVFLYFLQKKGWFGVARGQDWGKGRKDFIRHLFANRADYVSGLRKRPVNFFNDILEPLFYEAIAAPRTDDDHYYSRFDCRIPFLNGGLFEPLYGYDWVETEILLPDTLFANAEPTGEEDEKGTGILDVFDRYNFTVNESEPLEKEVAVDPEMLGKVFENLLPENIRHSSGTYYTPRVIVHYMCQQALLHYLTARAPQIPPADLALFLRLAERYADFEAKETKAHADKLLPEAISQNAGQLDDLLATITVCDPAIGSGAFPVGMMLEIVRARMALTGAMVKQNDPRTKKPRTAYALKRDAIQHSLYGVDLDPGAVEIAKLRLWLSMVVDEDEIRDIQPLPNLDYKIMQGNSLLEEFNGVRLLDDKLLQPPATSRDAEIAELKARRSALQAEAIRMHGDGKKGAAQKLAAEQEIKRLNKRLTALVNPGEAEAEAQGELNQQTSWANLKRIQELHDQFFDENTRVRKQKLRKDLDALEWNFMEATLREQGHSEAIAQLKHASATHRKPFFLWRLHFGEVFQQNGGFDVVIANPPYIGQKHHNAMFQEVKKSALGKYHQRRMDYFYFFFHAALNLTRSQGCVAFITTNYFLTATYADKLREDIKARASLRVLVNFNELKIFESALGQHNIITVLTNGHVPQNKIECRFVSAGGFGAPELLWSILHQQPDCVAISSKTNADIYEGDSLYIRMNYESLTDSDLFGKITSKSQPLGEVCDLVEGIHSGADKISESHLEKFKLSVEKGTGIYVLSASELRQLKLTDQEKSLIKPWFKNSDIQRWHSETIPDKYLIYYTTKEKYGQIDNIRRHLSQFKLILINRKTRSGTGIISERDYDDFVSDKKYISYVMNASAFKRGDYYCVSYPRERRVFENPKIVVPQRSPKNTFAFNTIPWYASADVYFILEKSPDYDLKFILALLNSKLFYFWLYHKGKRKGDTLELYIRPLSEIPIKTVTKPNQRPFIDLVDQILTGKAKDANADVSKQEQELDKLIYDLYRLTRDEIKLVEDAQPEKAQPAIAEPTLPNGKRQTLGGVKYAIQLVQALLTESAGGLSWPRLVDAFTLATQPNLLAQETASADATKVKAWAKRWSETLPPGALITAIEQLGATNLAVKKSGNTWHIRLKTEMQKSSAADVNYDAWLALRVLGPAPQVQLAAPFFATPLFADWTRTIEALAA